ncbi:MAG: head-tail adaptor protein [Psychrilyobacter sp.]|uniref:phage head completion protein n=1 Tax=Psychrilyobacter sp. TaxID=2586924 RepID=UPI003C794855
MTNELNQRVELWGMTDVENELGEVDRIGTKIKDIWCKILPKHGKISKIGSTDIEEVNLNLIIRCRKLSVKNPSIDMFFKKGNQKYQVIDWIPDLKNNSFLEFFCGVTYE